MPRKARIVTISMPNADGPTIADNLARAEALVAYAGAGHPDYICLPEVFATRGVPYADVAEVAQTVPGPITDTIAAHARRLGAYIVCPLLARRGDRIYNTAVLLDRHGQVAGLYDKVHPVPGEDGVTLERGVHSGSAPHVIETDLGRVGMQICFDMNWPNEWAALKQQGAELVFWPSAFEGGLPLQSRAMDNHYTIVTSTTMLHSRIIDLTGRVIAESGTYCPFAEAVVDLEARVLSTDWNLEKAPAIRERYGADVTIRMLLDEDMMILQSERAGLTVDDIMREFGLERWSDYIARCTVAQALRR